MGHSRTLFISAVLVSICLYSAAIAAQQNAAGGRPKISFGCGFAPNSSAYLAAEALYKKAFDQLGYDFEMLYRPSRRSLIEADQGVTDGDCGRIAHLLTDTDFKHLVKVNAAIIRGRIVFWAMQSKLTELPPEQLLLSPVRIGYMRGIVAFDRILKDRPSSLNIQFNDLKQGFKMLQGNRIDVLMAYHTLGVQALAELKLKSTPLEFGKLVTHLGQPYLNRRHAALANPLAALIDEALQDPNHPLNLLSD